MLIASLMDPTIVVSRQPTRPSALPRHVQPSETEAIAACFMAARTGFDADGEYSAWLVQRRLYTGLARWAAATELHGEISALWATGQFAEHKAVLLDPRLIGRRPGPRRGNRTTADSIRLTGGLDEAWRVDRSQPAKVARADRSRSGR